MAKSLLAYDVRLFRRVIPWQCLGSVWSRREQRSSSEIHTVKGDFQESKDLNVDYDRLLPYYIINEI